MKYFFHPAARREFIESIDYYEKCQTGLGRRFAMEIFATIQLILQFPDAWPMLSKNTRRCLSRRFPFGVVYQVLGNEIIVIAVMQLNRKPGYWQDRLV